MRAKVMRVQATELKPGKRYIIAVDARMIAKEDAVELAKEIVRAGIENSIVAVFNGNPQQGLQVIEQAPR